MNPNNLNDLKKSLDSISPSDVQKNKMLNNILNSSSKTYSNTRFTVPKHLYPLVASIILVIGGSYYISHINTFPGNPDMLPSHSQTSPSEVGVRKFMNYNGNRYAVLDNISDELLNSLELSNYLGTLNTPIDFYDNNESDSSMSTNFSSTFALGGEVWETSKYDSRYRVIIKDVNKLYLCEMVGKSNDSTIDIDEFIIYGDFHNRISEIDIISSTNSLLNTLLGKELDLFINELSTATFTSSSSLDYDKLFSEESRASSLNIVFKFDDGTTTNAILYPHLSVISLGDNYFSLPSSTLSQP